MRDNSAAWFLLRAMVNHTKVIVLLVVVGVVVAVDVTNLRCEYRTDPLGIDTARPRLSWILVADRRGEVQSAYQILVASTPDRLAQDQGDLWDSGKVASDQQNQLDYAGSPLGSGTRCWWKVRVWDRDDKPATWSHPATWTMGLLKPTDWQARWIGVTPPGAPRPALLITQALVSGPAGAPTVDVTPQLVKQINDNRLSIKTDERTLGLSAETDPQVKRTVTVNYELGGQPQPALVLGVSHKGESLTLGAAREWPIPRYLRKPFVVERAVRRATVYATALGVYELRLNGQRVGDQLLAPEWTNYHKRVQVQTYDVTALVRSGRNVMGAMLGNGWYCGGWQHWQRELVALYGTEPYFLAQLDIELSDGTHQQVVTDASWRGTVDGPLRMAGIYEGETYDATKDMPGWDGPDFGDTAWAAAQLARADLKVGNLVWQRSEPIRLTRELNPISVSEVKPGVYVFAFDQNMAGYCRFSFLGKSGQTVELQYGEMLKADGTVFLGNLLVVSQHQIQLDRYTFRTDHVETHEPRFTYHGFQYVEVRGLTEKPDLNALTGVVFNSDCPEVGEFTCSNPKINRLAQNILWSQRANFMGIPTDCPQRNERCGYPGDAQFFMPTAIYGMDVAAFYNKCLVDLCQDSANEQNGAFGDHMPDFQAGGYGNVGWGDAGIICPYLYYRTYGDTRLIRDHYEPMRRHMEFWIARADKEQQDRGGIRDSGGPKDWLNLNCKTKSEVIATAYYAYLARLIAEMANVIDRPDDAQRYRRIAEETRTAFTAAFIRADGAILGSSQTGFALAFTMGLVPEAIRGKMANQFSAEIGKHNDHLATGFIGTPRLLPGLHQAGRDDLAYKLLLTETSPSWLYPVTVGATTMWERWNAWDGKTAKGGMNSLNHYSFGAVGEYLYGTVGGIQADAPGYQNIRIAPVIREGLTWANTRYDSIRGRIVSNWKREAGHLTMEVTIPANTTATVWVPAKDAAMVREGSKPAAQAEGVRFIRQEGDCAVFAVGSGTYAFSVE